MVNPSPRNYSLRQRRSDPAASAKLLRVASMFDVAGPVRRALDVATAEWAVRRAVLRPDTPTWICSAVPVPRAVLPKGCLPFTWSSGGLRDWHSRHTPSNSCSKAGSSWRRSTRAGRPLTLMRWRGISPTTKRLSSRESSPSPSIQYPRPVWAPLGNEAGASAGEIDTPPNSKSTEPPTLDTQAGKGQRLWAAFARTRPRLACDKRNTPISALRSTNFPRVVPIAVSRPPELAQTSRLRAAARIGTGPCSHPVDADTQEDAGANDRRSKKNQQPQCGGHAPETTPQYRITATLSRLAKLAPQDGGATKIGPPPTSLVAGRSDELSSSGPDRGNDRPSVPPKFQPSGQRPRARPPHRREVLRL